MYEARCFTNVQLLIFRGIETSEVFEIIGMNNVERMIINSQYEAHLYHNPFLSNQGSILVLQQDCNKLL